MSLLNKVVSAGEFDWAKEDIYCCNACGASSPLKGFEHYKSCGGLAEVKKWEDYYNDPSWANSFKDDD